eukprot:scaffold59720_cov19-Tisochrysis_lutea.AAC.1
MRHAVLQPAPFRFALCSGQTAVQLFAHPLCSLLLPTMPAVQQSAPGLGWSSARRQQEFLEVLRSAPGLGWHPAELL